MQGYIKEKTRILFAVLVGVVLLPHMVYGQGPAPLSDSVFGPLVPCETVANPHECEFDDLVQGVQNIVNLLVALSTFGIALGFAWIGFILVKPGERKESDVTKAKEASTKLLIGTGLTWGAWLIVSTISRALLADEFLFILGS